MEMSFCGDHNYNLKRKSLKRGERLKFIEMFGFWGG